MIGANGKGLRQLTHSALNYEVESPSWSPDGKSILYSYVGDDDTAVLQAISARGGPPRTLVSGPLPAYFPDWQPLR